MPARVVAVSAAPRHAFSKRPLLSVRLVAGLGVAGDAHAGATVKHRSRVARDPTAPNLRQVHLLPGELLDDLAREGFPGIRPGDLGENVLTAGLDLLGLSAGTRLGLGRDAVLEVTGLRNPCIQLDRFRPGLMSALIGRGPGGERVRRAGIMAVVLRDGDVHAGDPVTAEAPAGPPRPLGLV